MSAATDVAVEIARVLLGKGAQARSRLAFGQTLRTGTLAGALAGFFVVVMLLLLPNGLTELTSLVEIAARRERVTSNAGESSAKQEAIDKHPWDRLRTMLLGSGLIGGGIGGAFLVIAGRLVASTKGVGRSIVATSLVVLSGGLTVLFHCLASYDAPHCKPNLEWLALGGAVGVTTAIACLRIDFALPEAPFTFTWQFIVFSVFGLIVYSVIQAAYIVCGGGEFAHPGRGFVTFLGSVLFLEVFQFGLWLKAGGSEVLRAAIVGGNSKH